MLKFKFKEQSSQGRIFQTLRLLAYAIPIELHGDLGLVNHILFESNFVQDADKVGKEFPFNVTIIDDKNIKDKKEMSRLIEMRLKVIKNAIKDVKGIYYLVNKPYRLMFLNHTKQFLSEKDYNELLASCWTLTEFPVQHPGDVRELTNMFRLSTPKLLYDLDEKGDAEDYKFFCELPDAVTTYRGCQSKSAYIRGLSWTLDLEKAHWFANRWKKSGGVFQAEVNKKDIFYYTNSRNEKEVVVNPYKLKKIVKIGGKNDEKDKGNR